MQNKSLALLLVAWSAWLVSSEKYARVLFALRSTHNRISPNAARWESKTAGGFLCKGACQNTIQAELSQKQDIGSAEAEAMIVIVLGVGKS